MTITSIEFYFLSDLDKIRTIRHRQSKLISWWYFEPSQPQRITPGLTTIFSLSLIYSVRKSSNHKLSKKLKISPDTNLQKIFTNIKHKIFEELVPSVLPLLKKKRHIRLGHAGIVDHSVHLHRQRHETKDIVFLPIS